MWGFKRKAGNGSDGGAQVAERPDADAARAGFSGTAEELLDEIARLSAANRVQRDRQTERRLLWLRHLEGIRRMDASGASPAFPAPDAARLPERGDALPAIARADLSPALLRAGILRDGCVLVRGLVDRDAALRFAAQIDRAFAERDALAGGTPPAEGYYEEFQPDGRFEVAVRGWVQQGGGLLAADSPVLAFEMQEMFEAAGLPALVGGYLGEPPLTSVHKTTLRKAEPTVGGAWHQDGAFMGDVRALNLWLSLSRCGDEAPGLDLIPRRIDEIVVDRAGTVLNFDISQAKAEEVAGETGIIRPIFEPGDALFFDELFLHQTGSEPGMTKPRFAIENWFFGASAFPGDYAPIAV